MTSKVTKPLFSKILVANRGEIAVRVIRGIQDLGILAVAVASEPDQTSEHVRLADEVIFLPGATPAESYLQGQRIIKRALEIGVEAVHPGYGFLSENADFAQACQDAGLVFIGPSPTVIREMGDKIRAKSLMESAGVPVVPGWSGEANTDFKTVQVQADAIGYPVLVKAAAGGGGKGMRLVDNAAALEAAWESAAREAQSAFGDARIFLEKYLTRPRHVEFQILGDHHGQTVHLYERECSIQRRHQKLVEETPSPALTPDLRARMSQAALKAANAMRYTNAGTIEFILDESGNFYFLEVNTRLQVEHPVTELTIGQDLVRLQIMVAAGLPLPFTQNELQPRGHAVECRICAEDPDANFMPATGRLDVYRPPEGPFIRMDGGFREGGEVTVYYDSLLGKLIVWGPDRDTALDRMSRALSRFVLLGVANNIAFLRQVIDHPEFRAGRSHTHFLTDHQLLPRGSGFPPTLTLPREGRGDLPSADSGDCGGGLTLDNADVRSALALVALPGAILPWQSAGGASRQPQDNEPQRSPWATGDGWRAGKGTYASH